jgi:hypothetical protein
MLCDDEHFAKYRQMQLNSFVDENEMIAWSAVLLVMVAGMHSALTS